MLPLLVTVFLASLLGSLHCAGMCGAFVALAVGGAGPTARPQGKILQAAYHTGRLATYLALGTLAGAVGSTVDLGGNMVGIQHTAAALAGAMMIAFGVGIILRWSGWKSHLNLGFKKLEPLLIAGHRISAKLSPVNRALAIGLLTTLLPCGWLWAFVLTAAGTGRPLAGALTMAVFWAGTLPVLASVGWGVQKIGGRLAGKLPLAAGLSIVAVGTYTVITRTGMAGMIGRNHVVVRDTASLIGSVESLDSSKSPCCVKHDP